MAGRCALSRIFPGALLFLIFAGACAPREPTPVPPPPEPEVREEVRAAASRALARAEALLEAGRTGAAARVADSLHLSWRDERAMEEMADQALHLQARALEADGQLAASAHAYEALLPRLRRNDLRVRIVRRLAAIRHATGAPAAGVELLLEHPSAIDDHELELLREMALRLEDTDLRWLISRYGPERPGGAVLHGEDVRRLALEGRWAEAERTARRLLASDPPDPERRAAEVVLAGAAGEEARFTVGAVLPLSGRFAEVGTLLQEGIELALAEFRAPDRRVQVELRVLDDGSDSERAVELVRQLEAEGVVAVLGPIRSESFTAAAHGRRDPRLPLVSPTATEIPAPVDHVYTLWSRERRERKVARDLAEWAVQHLHVQRAAILYPTSEAGREAAEAFGEGMRSAGGLVVGLAEYPTDATTFEDPIRRLADVDPDLVFVAAETVPTILQIAPQLTYYGLSGRLVMGGAAWSDPTVVRRLDSTTGNYILVGTFVDRVSPGTRWESFKVIYEQTYSKPLRENMIPALAFDAMELVLAAVGEAGLPFPGAVAAALTRLPERPGATGLLLPDPETSTVTRRTVIRVLDDRTLEEADPIRILEWLEEARERRELEADSEGESR